LKQRYAGYTVRLNKVCFACLDHQNRPEYTPEEVAEQHPHATIVLVVLP